VDIERVLIPEMRRDNDAHVIAHLHLYHIYIRVCAVSLFCQRGVT